MKMQIRRMRKYCRKTDWRQIMTRDEQLISLCQSLIRIPSLSGQEEQVARFIEKTMHAYGYDEVQIDKHGSVLGCIRGKRPGKRILMDGHIDTVDIADRDRWTHDPFAPKLRTAGSTVAAPPI